MKHGYDGDRLPHAAQSVHPKKWNVLRGKKHLLVTIVETPHVIGT